MTAGQAWAVSGLRRLALPRFLRRVWTVRRVPRAHCPLADNAAGPHTLAAFGTPAVVAAWELRIDAGLLSQREDDSLAHARSHAGALERNAHALLEAEQAIARGERLRALGDMAVEMAHERGRRDPCGASPLTLPTPHARCTHWDALSETGRLSSTPAACDVTIGAGSVGACRLRMSAAATSAATSEVRAERT